MKFCFPPHVLFSSPPLSKTLQGKIFFKIGKFAEDHIADDYQKFTGRKDWYPKPITADDFRDGSQQLSAKTLYFSFLVEKNPGVDKAKLEELMNQRAISGPDGQIVYIPDFISEKSPAAKRFYEVKPGIANERNEAGETKIASVRALMQDVDLPYKPGALFKPTGKHELYKQTIYIPGAMILPLPITVTFEYQRHDKIDGLIVYSFCIDADFKKTLLAAALIVAIVAIIVLAVLFPELLKEIPLPPWFPSPASTPAFGLAPANVQPFRNLLASYPAPRTVPDMRARALTGSVGAGGRNAPDDVQIVQFLLNAWQGLVRSPFLELDGIAGPLTRGAIVAVQQAAGLRYVDGRVDPGGPTLEVLGKLGAIGIAMTLRNTPRSPYVMRNLYPPLMEGDLLSIFWSSLASRGRG
ncbi:peptidoglycan-binding domain-containing protein [Reyranella sp.]|uniref:peptidoglycan-binding domain-containing protein n=1 Tax=Reyranella sp. TaxID=1929291 RepID=UPI0012065BA7|nr:peptidoglycan-binding domain-containing protein [Reyranella sp.]TAJ84684.1 MAG: hypothetical protein EPO50_18555 [Reyranella sp.]